MKVIADDRIDMRQIEVIEVIQVIRSESLGKTKFVPDFLLYRFLVTLRPLSSVLIRHHTSTATRQPPTAVARYTQHMTVFKSDLHVHVFLYPKP